MTDQFWIETIARILKNNPAMAYKLQTELSNYGDLGEQFRKEYDRMKGPLVCQKCGEIHDGKLCPSEY